MKPLAYLGSILSSSPVLTVASALLAAALPLAVRRRRLAALASIPAIAALCLYGAITIASPNHDARFVLPILVGLPFALIVPWARLDEPGGEPAARHVLLWILAGVLLSAPMVARYDFTNVIDQARLVRGLPAPGKQLLLLATDSPSLDTDTLQAALELVPERKGQVGIDTVVYDDADGRDLAFSMGKIARASHMVLQSDGTKLWPDWTNKHVEVFRQVARAQGRAMPELSTKDFEVYALEKTRESSRR
jgi:MFS family permease